MENQVKFNRQELFGEGDMDIVMDAIRAAKNENDPTLQNMLFGLFDGILYNDLRDRVANLPTDIVKRMNHLIDGILNEVTEEEVLYPNGLYYVGEYGASVSSDDIDEIEEQMNNDEEGDFYNEIPEGSVISVKLVKETDVEDIFEVKVVTDGNGEVPFDCRKITTDSEVMYGTTHSIFGSENVKFIK